MLLIKIHLQVRKDSNPQLPALEADALPIELLTYLKTIGLLYEECASGTSGRILYIQPFPDEAFCFWLQNNSCFYTPDTPEK